MHFTEFRVIEFIGNKLIFKESNYLLFMLKLTYFVSY